MVLCGVWEIEEGGPCHGGTLEVLGGERAERSSWGRDTPEVKVPQRSRGSEELKIGIF